MLDFNPLEIVNKGVQSVVENAVGHYSEEQWKVWYTVDRAPEGWKYSTGFITEDMIRDHLPAASEHTYTFMCAH